MAYGCIGVPNDSSHNNDCRLFCKLTLFIVPHFFLHQPISYYSLQVPETPLWLLSKNRTEDALKSLQWLRGWVSPKAVETEFKSLQRYNERSNSCNVCAKRNVKCTHPAPTIWEKLRELTRKRTLKPFLLVMSIFLLSQFTGILAMRPYTVQILQAYGIPLDASWATVIVGLVGLFGNIILLCIIRLTGKRKIYLFALAVTFISCFVLGKY